MLSCSVTLRRLGGVAHRQELLAAGLTGLQLTREVRLGQIIRARIGWYVSVDLDPLAISAITIGGRLASLSAAVSYGLWVPPFDGIHVSVTPGSSRFRAAVGESHVHFHWDGDAISELPRHRVSIIDCLVQIVTNETIERAVCVLDSAVNAKLISTADLLTVAARVPRRKRRAVGLVDARAESGIETLTRLRLRSIGIDVFTQVDLAPGIRVDFLLGRSVVVEVDGRETHVGVEEFERDRSRDAVLNALGYRVLHFSYSQVMFDWPTVQSTILLVLRQPSTR